MFANVYDGGILGPRVTVLAGDATDPTAMDALAAHPRETVDAVDPHLVNAGVTAFLGLPEVTEQDHDRLFAINTRGPILPRAETRAAATRGRRGRPRRVRVNAVSPGPTDTGILERTLPVAAARATRKQMQAANPMQRFGRPGEVAAAVAFLGFEATFTTGAELVVDGGAPQL